MNFGHIKTIYNFTFRLSGNTRVAEVLTEKVFLMHSGNQKNCLILLKQAWEDFLQYYGCLVFKGEEPIQGLLLSLLPEVRCAVILRDIMGYSYRQIAIILNTSNSQVAKLVSQGRQEINRKGIKQNISSCKK